MIPYEKYHGTGNDFVVVDAENHVPDRAAFATAVCDRSEGVTAGDGDVGDAAGVSADGETGVGSGRTGADGVLFLHLEPEFRPPRVVMTLVQPDGSTAAMCGNGARCAAAWAAARTTADEVMIDTLAGTRHAEILADEVTVEMGEPSFEPADVPLAGDEPLIEAEVGGYEVTAVDTGVPHAVAFVDDVADVDLEVDGPAIRHAEEFPEGANVTFASPRDDGGFDQRTFERGVEGETASCGTGAVAIAVVARHLGLADDGPVAVHPPGGDLAVSFDDRGVPRLHGPVVREFDGEADATPVRTVDA
ncbi:MAG TPA: diaminopimelate epimerase [Halobacteriales archaeon]|nr:diaminopimelate epimerase [Halobacteriales archaeon]